MLRLISTRLIACMIVIPGIFCLQLKQAKSEAQKAYIGAEACRKCHEEQYDRFERYAKKARSYEHIMMMKKGLTETEFRRCLECHTTGYGKPGGFVSEHETPHLKEAGCEVCHGPGSLHAESQDPNDIKRTISSKDCDACHSGERVQAFHYRPMIFGGAH